MRIKTFEEALRSAEASCARSERCEQDIRRKCQAWGLDEEEASRLVAALKKGRYIDHGRYAAAFAREKSRLNKWGAIKIAAALRAKGIESEVAREALASLPSEEEAEETLASLLRAKDSTLRETDARRRRDKLLRFAVGRGYPLDMASRVVDCL